MRPAVDRRLQARALDKVEVREGNGQLVVMAARRNRAHHGERCRLHRLLRVVDEQDHVDRLETAGYGCRNASAVVGRVADALSIDQHQLDSVLADRRIHRTPDANAVHHRRQQTAEVRPEVA